MNAAVQLLMTLDQVLGGLLEGWDDQQSLILITSDHGNMEDLSTRRHTYNPVPALLVGNADMREEFSSGLKDITGITPAILKLIKHNYSE
jgi:bisphosphoglycerate-independent phosphoglycerate mutase (AlkP superfamily)